METVVFALYPACALMHSDCACLLPLPWHQTVSVLGLVCERGLRVMGAIAFNRRQCFEDVDSTA